MFKKRKETYNGVQITRIPLVPRGNNAVMLALNYLSFVIAGYFWKAFTKIKADYVFIFEVSPMTQALPGVWYAKKRKIPCYLYVTDLWPENVEIAAGIKNKRILKAIGVMVDYIYERCDKIFTSSESFIKAITSRGFKKEKLEFWPQYAEDYYMPVEIGYIYAVSYTHLDVYKRQPLFLLLIVAIKLDSAGPVLFKQKRIGIHKSHFNILKFRTMRIDTPGDIPTHLLENPEEYITKMGRFLRKTSLDELPQIINILKGEMSICLLYTSRCV